MHPTIVLIGPYQAGKSTVRRLLAEGLGLPHASLGPFEDPELCYRYYREAGYDDGKEERLPDATAVHRYMRPFKAYAVERCVAEHPGHVIELGATHAAHEGRLLECVRRALSPHPVALLLPSPDPEESHRVLRRRSQRFGGLELNEHFLEHPSNGILATATVYTGGRSPEQTADEILALIGHRPPSSGLLLIGPSQAGKSTVARLLAARLGMRRVSMDGVKGPYYDKISYDHGYARRLQSERGFRAMYDYWKPFEAHSTERILAEHRGAIIDFGAGHSVYEDGELFERVRRAVSAYEHTILLVPSPDPDESVRMLEERPRSTIDGIDANRYLIGHPAHYDLAKRVVYTEGRTPEQTCDELLRAFSGWVPDHARCTASSSLAEP